MADEIEDNTIEIVEFMLDNKMAAVMFTCGIIAGAFFLYVFLSYQKNRPIPTLGVDATEGLTVEGEPVFPSLRGQSNTQPLIYEG